MTFQPGAAVHYIFNIHATLISVRYSGNDFTYEFFFIIRIHYFVPYKLFYIKIFETQIKDISDI